MVYSVTGFHTCNARGTKAHLEKKVPFLSRPDGQWLGQGYYFWTDSDYWAHRWGKGEKVISRFGIAMDRENLLDLVGSVKDQQTLEKILSCFREEPLWQAYLEKFHSELCISQVLTWLREERNGEFEGIFPYWAVRAKDKRKVSSVRFLADRDCREELSLVERHQICVYQEYKDAAVTFECFVHPENFMDVTEGALA